MQDIVAAAIQMNAVCGKTEENLARHEILARKAAGQGVELICFPELSISGHFVNETVWKHSEPVPGGPSCIRMERLAKELNVVISAGIAERENNVCFNTQFVVGPQGFIGKYRKTHASRDEYFYFRMGARFPVWDIGKCRVGILICYDIAFPEVARILALNGAELILAPHASRCGKTKPAEQRKRVLAQLDFFCKMGSTRCSDNGVFMVMNNQAGDAGGHLGLDVVHGGGIVIVDPGGNIVAESRSRSFRDEIVIAELKAEAFDRARTRRCHNLQTRRPEIYGRLTEIT